MQENQTHIPKGWKDVLFGDVIQIVKNGFSGNQVDKITSFPVTRIETISNGNIDFDKIGYVERIPDVYSLIKGDILISNINSVKHIGKLAYFESDRVLYHGMNLLLLRFKEIDSKFIYYYLLTKKQWFEKEATQAINQASINQNTLKKYLWLTIPENPKEQTQIATILSKVDEAITHTVQLIAKHTRIKTGLMQDILTKGISQNSELIISDLKGIEINSQFKQCKFENITKVRQGFQIAISKRKKEEGVNRHIYITVQYLNNPKKYLEFIENPPENVICSADEILFTRTGNTGQIVSGIKGVFHNNFFKVSFDEKEITREYLMLYLNWEPVQDLIKELAGTTTIPDMKHKDFYGMPIFFPPSITEQKEITDVVNSSNHSIISYQKELSKLQSLKRGLMQDLLSGKVRVNHLIKETANV
jgi:type I restriction enzyme S subunit